MSKTLPNYPGHPDDWTDKQWEHYRSAQRKADKERVTNPVETEALARGDFAYFAYQLRYHNNPWGYKKKHIKKALPRIDLWALHGTGTTGKGRLT